MVGRIALPLLVVGLVSLWWTTAVPGVAEASGTFNPPHSEYGLDTDDDGLFNYLVVEVSLDITEAGDFLVEGNLHDSDNTFGAVTFNQTTLEVGAHTVPLWFYGPVIKASGADGPYEVSLVLSYYPASGPPASLDGDTYVTETRAHTDFDGHRASLEWPHADRGLDTDGDNRFNLLVVEIRVHVSEAGTFLVYGNLHNANFSLSLVTENVTGLPVGEHTVPLWFSGVSIHASGADGPYTVNLNLHDAEENRFIEGGPHTTAAYSHLDFEEPSMGPTGPLGLLPLLAIPAAIAVVIAAVALYWRRRREAKE